MTTVQKFRSVLPEAGIALALMLLLLVFWDLPVSHDVTWQLWIARQLLHGTQLYAEIIEINPPLWFWAAMPIQSLSEATSLPARSLLVAATIGLTGLALLLLSQLFENEKPGRRACILFAALIGMVLIPIHEFAQREQLALISALPYAMLAARRAEGKAAPVWLAMTVGLLAAYGFALKHYFLLVPIVLEGWLAFFHRPRWKVLRAETLTLALCGLAYGAAVVWFTPEFFDTIVPMVAAAYDGYARPLEWVATRPWVILWGIGLLGLAVAGRPLKPQVMAGLLTTLCFVFAYFIQQKGWLYHSVSATGALFFTLSITVFFQHPCLRWWKRHPTLPVTLVLFAILSSLQGPYKNPSSKAVNQLLEGTKPGETAVILSIHPTPAWPMVDQNGHEWPLRLFSYWMLPAIANTPEHLKSAELKSVEAQTIRMTRDDLWCQPPHAIIVDDSRTSPYMGRSFDMIGWLSSDQALAELFSHYKPIKTLGAYTLLKPVGRPQPDTRRSCRQIS